MPKPSIKPNIMRRAGFTDPNTSLHEFRNGMRTASTLQGGLLELRTDENDGTLRVDLYRLDPKVIVTVSADPGNAHGAALQAVTRAMLAVRNEHPDATEADYLRAVASVAMDSARRIAEGRS